MVEAIIFDVDGTLIDSVDLHARAWQDVFLRYGVALQGLFERLRRDGIKIALGSSAKEEELKVYKKITGIEPFLAEETSSDEVSHSKPDPDIFIEAQKKLGIDPGNIVVIGDTHYDAESAGKARMYHLVIPGSGRSAEKRRELAIGPDIYLI